MANRTVLWTPLMLLWLLWLTFREIVQDVVVPTGTSSSSSHSQENLESAPTIPPLQLVTYNKDHLSSSSLNPPLTKHQEDEPQQRTLCIPSSECDEYEGDDKHTPQSDESLAAYQGRVYSTYEANVENQPNYVFINQNEYQFRNVVCLTARYQQVHPDKGAIHFIVLPRNETQQPQPHCDATMSALEKQGMAIHTPKSCTAAKNTQRYHIDEANTLTIPYITGIYHTGPLQQQPKPERSIFFSYIGSVWRNSNRRSILIHSLFDATNNGERTFTSTSTDGKEVVRTLFSAPMVVTSKQGEREAGWGKGNISILAKTTYLDSVFSLQPPGDTPTRRAFYECLLLGTIPVAPFSAMENYRHVFPTYLNSPGIPFHVDGVQRYNWMDQMVVSLPDDDCWNATKLLEHLKGISAKEIEQRQTAIQSFYAKYLIFSVDNDVESFWTIFSERFFEHDYPCYKQ